MNAQQIADKLKQLSIQEDTLSKRWYHLQTLPQSRQRDREITRTLREWQMVRARIAKLEAQKC